MRRSTPRRALHGLLVAGLAGGLMLAGTGAASADLSEQEPPPPPSGGLSRQVLHDSVRVFDPAGSVRVFDPSVHVLSLEDDVTRDDGETTIALSTDLLFRENTWELPRTPPRG
ncbi:hypothetical protein M3148_06960 [Georgenia satyanarayanai]|uniref:hypothetical protein n=1 Tax=Georgenia satyanarayanai TaxID=860221 RepID=UPI00203FE570|nr:hypothetical protein [Georgenia satyanarayanai]MCM3660734.1 hypothetical protein [Georgenia satyanarayanai]